MFWGPWQEKGAPVWEETGGNAVKTGKKHKNSVKIARIFYKKGDAESRHFSILGVKLSAVCDSVPDCANPSPLAGGVLARPGVYQE